MKPLSKYQPEVDELMKKLKPDAIVLVVIGGARGDGAASEIRADLLARVGAILVTMGKEHLKGDLSSASRFRIEYEG